MTVQFYNSLTNKIEDFTPLKDDVVTMYNCGPTVYDYAHIGNFRSFLLADLIRRVLELNGYNVRQVMNITDVGHMTQDDTLSEEGEDKMAAALKKTEKKDGYKSLNFTSPWDVADYYIKAFMEDFESLNLKKPIKFPRATEYIEPMLAMVKILIDKGHAYQAPDGSYYFDITTFPEYGKLSNNTLENLRSGAGGRTDDEQTKGKRNHFDFALWKVDDAHLMKWESELGTGFPGWHLECSAMSKDLLGQSIDIHTGGEDNKFPHHECEIAQSEGVSGEKFVNYWLHSKFLQVEGEKMAKSKGNFYTIRDLVEKGYHPLAIRWVLISTHYGQTLNFTLKSLDDAQKNIDRLYTFKQNLEEWSKANNPSESKEDISVLCEQTLAEYKAALNQNINISGALATLFTFEGKVKKQPLLNGEEAKLCLDTLKKLDSVLGVVFDYEPKAVDEGDAATIEAMIAKRNQARKDKDWKLADQMRDELAKMNVEIMDSKDGTTWKMKS